MMFLIPAQASSLSCRMEPGRITLQTGDRIYSIGNDGYIQPLGMFPNISGTSAEGKDVWLVPVRIREAKIVADMAHVKTVRAIWELSEGSPRQALELDLEVRRGAPALLVRSRARRLSEGGGNSYYYWGLPNPVSHYTVPGDSPREFLNEWHVLPHYRWVYIAKSGAAGYGVMTDGKVGRSPVSGGDLAGGESGGSPYLICRQRTAYLTEGAAHEVDFAVMTARNPGEVAAVHRKIRSLKPDRMGFDAQTFSRKAFTRKGTPAPAAMLATQDGFSLALSEAGQVAGVRVGPKALSGGSRYLSGLLLRDYAARSQPKAVGGSIRQAGDRVEHSARCLDVEVRASYTARPDRIDAHCDLKDLAGKDRAVTLYYALPVRAGKGWQWHDDLERSREIAPEDEYIASAESMTAGANGLNSRYPFASVTGPGAGLGIGVPMDRPRVCRMFYNSDTGQFVIAFDLALLPEVKRWPSSASVDFSLFLHDPAWGFRACAEKYYRIHPQFFAKRAQKDGGWVCWGNVADVSDVEELGYAYHWGPASAAAVEWDNDHGLYSFPYVEATNMHQTMEEFQSATGEDVVNRLKWVADPERNEPLPKWQYDHPYSEFLGDRDAALRQTAQVYLNSLLYDSQGKIYGEATKTEFNLLIAKYIPCNANPALPGGLGEYFLNIWLPRAQQAMEAAGGRVDGIAQDNYHVGDTVLDYRREHFPYAASPLTFETGTARPVILKNFTTYEFTSAFRRRHPGKLTIANTCSAQFPFTFSLLDIHGYEWNIESLSPFARTMAYHKPVCTLPVQEAHKDEKWVKAHIRYGFFPGGYANYRTLLNREAMKKYVPVIRQLSEAGWEPVTDARSSDPDITLERFGKDCFTIYNRSAQAKTARIAFEKRSLSRAADMITGGSYPARGGAIEITLPGRDVTAVRVEK
ncbi:MAG: hypothetical protein IT210_23115 [Armatimonadetes bacterium]|nr:hypothetical protein [Armatimonadota bacterium]